MNSGKLQQNILSTYFWLRGGIVFLSFVLPIALYIGGRAGLLESMSAYYGGANAFARNWFVGTLWVVGAFLILSRGSATPRTSRSTPPARSRCWCR